MDVLQGPRITSEKRDHELCDVSHCFKCYYYSSLKILHKWILQYSPCQVLLHIFVFCAYSIIGNSFIMLVIYLQHTLHTLKYIAVFNLVVSDFGGSSALIPKSLTLLILADRFIAICFPLRYHTIITKAAVSVIITGTWIVSSALLCTTVGFVAKLSFCNSIDINSYFCDHRPTCKLACNDTVLNNIMAYVGLIVALCVPLIVIAVTYLCIAIALLRIVSGAERAKAIKTCTSHLILVAIFYLPLAAVNIAAVTTSITPTARIINSSLSATMPPVLNPIIYTLKTEEVMECVNKLYRRYKVSSAVAKK